MAASHNALRAAKSANIKIVKMALTEEDIESASLDRLREVQRECEMALPKNTVFLIDIADIIGITNSTHIQSRAKKLGIKMHSRRRGGQHNKPALCVSEEDAEKIIRSYYESQ